MELNRGYINIFHMSGGGEVGNPGDRFFGIWRRPDNHKLHINLGVPKGGSSVRQINLDCVDGEWNTYVLEQRQHSDAPGTVEITLSIDGEEIESRPYQSDDVLVEKSIDAFVSREERHDK